jgi:hypothetical protein
MREAPTGGTQSKDHIKKSGRSIRRAARVVRAEMADRRERSLEPRSTPIAGMVQSHGLLVRARQWNERAAKTMPPAQLRVLRLVTAARARAKGGKLLPDARYSVRQDCQPESSLVFARENVGLDF